METDLNGCMDGNREQYAADSMDPILNWHRCWLHPSNNSKVNGMECVINGVRYCHVADFLFGYEGNMYAHMQRLHYW